MSDRVNYEVATILAAELWSMASSMVDGEGWLSKFGEIADDHRLRPTGDVALGISAMNDIYFGTAQRFVMYLPGDRKGSEHDDELSAAIYAPEPNQEGWYQVGQARSDGQNWRDAVIQACRFICESERRICFLLWDDAECAWWAHRRTLDGWIEVQLVQHSAIINPR